MKGKVMLELNVGKGIALSIDVARLNETVMAHVVKIGLKNILQDAHAGLPDAEAREKVNAKLATMYAGEVRVAKERAERDPVGAEAVKIATAQVGKIIGAKGQVKNEAEWNRLVPHLPGKDNLEKRENLITALGKSFPCRAEAEKIVAAKALVPTLDISAISFAE